MKYYFLIPCVMISLILGLIFCNPTLKGTIELYIIMNYKPFEKYIACDDILNMAASKDSTYADVSPYMNEEIYNNLSVKTKSYYRSALPYDEVIQVINQKQDVNDPHMLYVDIIQYNTALETVKWVRVRQLVAIKDGASWKFVKYIEPMTWNWYHPTYFGHVYTLILPNIH